MTLVPQLAAVVPESLSGSEADTFKTLLLQWQKKLRRNLLRTAYYDGKNRLRDMGIAIPPQLKSIETVVGWPAKAVDQLANRVRFDGFVVPGTEQDPFDVQSVLVDNNFENELAQATRSALTHSVAFVTTLQGDVQAGEPEVQIRFRSALYGTGIWDRRRRALSAALSITDVDTDGVPTELVMYLPEKVGLIARTGRKWTVVWRANPLGRVLVEPLVYHPDLDRPFGRSRINRAVMSITDGAVRTVLRTEVSAEFFTAPQRYALGVNDDSFTDKDGNPLPTWQAIIGRLWAITRDEEGELPQVGQFPQMSMEPHNAMLRAQAAQFSGETAVPISSLGVIQDNPSSAEAIFAAKEDIVIEAQNTCDTFSAALRRIAQNVVVLRDGLSVVPDELKLVQAKWRKPDRPSIVSSADAVSKQVSAVPWLADTEVILEELGYDHADITRLLSDKRRAGAGDLLISLREQATQAQADPNVLVQTTRRDDSSGAVGDAADLKAKFDALGVAVRAGVDPADAAARLGLAGVRFTGAVPVSLRLPETDATSLEEK